jgi:hypothetical protein
MLIRGILRQATSGEDDGGGGGTPPGPKYITEEQFNETLSKALTAHMKRELPKVVQSQLGELKLEERFSTLSEQLSGLANAPKLGKETESKGQDTDLQRQLQTLADQLETEKSARVAAEKASADAEAARRFDSARQKLRTGLQPKAHDKLLDDWVSRLTVLENRLFVDDDGNATVRVKHVPFKGSPEVEEDLPIDEAIPKLIERQEYHHYQAVPESGGGKNPGPRVGSRGSRHFNPKSDDPLERTRARLAEQGVSFEEEFGVGVG